MTGKIICVNSIRQVNFMLRTISDSYLENYWFLHFLLCMTEKQTRNSYPNVLTNKISYMIFSCFFQYVYMKYINLSKMANSRYLWSLQKRGSSELFNFRLRTYSGIYPDNLGILQVCPFQLRILPNGAIIVIGQLKWAYLHVLKFPG